MVGPTLDWSNPRVWVCRTNIHIRIMPIIYRHLRTWRFCLHLIHWSKLSGIFSWSSHGLVLGAHHSNGVSYRLNVQNILKFNLRNLKSYSRFEISDFLESQPLQLIFFGEDFSSHYRMKHKIQVHATIVCTTVRSTLNHT